MSIPAEGGKVRRCVAANDLAARRGDEVELEPAKPWSDPVARWAYLQVPVLFLLGLFLYHGGTLERILTGLILAALGFVLSWLMNRRARLRRRLEHRIARVVKKAPEG